MASRLLLKVCGLNHGHVIISGSFGPAGTGAPVVDSSQGRGFTVSRTAVGKYTITFDDKYANFVGAIPGIQTDADTQATVQLGAYDATAGTLAVKTFVGGSLADLAADADNNVHFAVFFGNKSFL